MTSNVVHSCRVIKGQGHRFDIYFLSASLSLSLFLFCSDHCHHFDNYALRCHGFADYHLHCHLGLL